MSWHLWLVLVIQTKLKLHRKGLQAQKDANKISGLMIVTIFIML